MKWFKHMTDASEDEFIANLEMELGLEGVARWWKLLEVIAKQMDKSDRHSASYPVQKWMIFLSCKQRKVFESFVKVLENFGKCFTKVGENSLEIGIPKLLEYRDEYSRKSGHTPDKVAPERRLKTKEADKKERKKEREVAQTPKKDLFENDQKTAPENPSPALTKMTIQNLPPEWSVFAKTEKAWTDAIIADVWIQFREYWQTGKGKAIKRADWFSTWRTWVRKENIRAPQQQQGGFQRPIVTRQGAKTL